MWFSVEFFVDSPKLSALMSMKKTELATLVQHYKLEVPSTMRKSNICKMLVECLVNEEIVSDDDVEPDTSAVDVKRLELRDKEKKRETQLTLKEIEENMSWQYR